MVCRLLRAGGAALPSAAPCSHPASQLKPAPCSLEQWPTAQAPQELEGAGPEPGS